MPVPLIGAAIGAVGSIGGAAMSASAAKDAAQTQAASADKALALQEKMYDQQRSDFQPWVTSGGQAATTLAAIMGLGGPVNGQRLLPAGTPATPAGATTLGAAMRAPAGSGLPQGARTPALQNGGEPTDIDMVMLRAPDGSMQAVPRRFMQHYVNKGAVVVQ